MQVVDYGYKKTYRENSIELAPMRNKLELLFEEYKAKCEEVGASTSVSPSVLRKGSRSNSRGSIDVDHEDD